GRGQMQVLDERVNARRFNYDGYKTAFQDIEALEFVAEPTGSKSNRWLTCMLTPSEAIKNNLIVALDHQNIEARPLWKPLHLQPIFEDAPRYLNGISEDLFKRGLCLPSGSSLSEEDLHRVCAVITQFFKQ
ncbi:DegT/DnrJ/EryC1/StrS family aminotransferase, partial [Psychroserpens sp.]|uniref:DegT/DnrJ/EryC1/StrS family aminotransferase n=1 Tax=Psychroserpens sp. TaxID=2020870 RepID=UPI003C795B95